LFPSRIILYLRKILNMTRPAIGTSNAIISQVYQADSLLSAMKFITSTTRVIIRNIENETMVLVCGRETIKVSCDLF